MQYNVLIYIFMYILLVRAMLTSGGDNNFVIYQNMFITVKTNLPKR